MKACTVAHDRDAAPRSRSASARAALGLPGSHRQAARAAVVRGGSTSLRQPMGQRCQQHASLPPSGDAGPWPQRRGDGSIDRTEARGSHSRLARRPAALALVTYQAHLIQRRLHVLNKRSFSSKFWAFSSEPAIPSRSRAADVQAFSEVRSMAEAELATSRAMLAQLGTGAATSRTSTAALAASQTRPRSLTDDALAAHCRALAAVRERAQLLSVERAPAR